MTISVVIPTSGRPQLLERLLASLAEVTRRGGAWAEVIVVDNTATSSVQPRIQALQSLFGCPLRHVREPRAGVARARNTGVFHAAGEIIAFLDDDTIPEPDWGEALLAAFRQHPDAAMLAGKVTPIFDEHRPPWMDAKLLERLGVLDFGPHPFPLDLGKHWVNGANMAIRREWIEKLGGFALELGHAGLDRRFGEESELAWRVAQQGGLVWYAPTLIVGHHLGRLTRRLVWARARAIGRSEVELRQRRGQRTSLPRRLPAVAVRFATAMLGRSSWVSAADEAACVLGIIEGRWKRRSP